MANVLKLCVGDRDCFAVVDRATFADPFSPHRAQLDREIVGAAAPTARAALTDAAIAAVHRRVRALEAAGTVHLARYGDDDRRLLRSALLFDAFHRCLDRFDRHIREQLAAGDEPLRITFAGETLALLEHWGFDRADALRSFALFFQLRRAFYFISHHLAGCSPCMAQLRGRLWDNLFTGDRRRYEAYLWDRLEDFSTLLLGETGTGKGAAAAAIGYAAFIPFDPGQNRFSDCFTRLFTAVNLSEYPETLIESVLFGHRKGAFTGAMEQHEGLFARCRPHGVIFLDEIGEMRETVQVKLLRVLQERQFWPVGSATPRRFSGRVIAATHRPVDRLRAQGRFRDDLYYRLCTDLIPLPPLRQRLEEEPAELALLVGELLRRSLGLSASELTEEFCAALRRRPGPGYPWPGNVRELEQAVRRLLLGRDYDGDAADTSADAADRLCRELRAGRLSARELLAGYCGLLHRRHGTYEQVARITGLDRRTAKKYADDAVDADC